LGALVFTAGRSPAADVLTDALSRLDRANSGFVVGFRTAVFVASAFASATDRAASLLVLLRAPGDFAASALTDTFFF
jgi:hypothetical protein